MSRHESGPAHPLLRALARDPVSPPRRGPAAVSDEEKQVLAALRAIEVNELHLRPDERKVLHGCIPRLAALLTAVGVRAPHPLHPVPEEGL
jgi:hypothetical protein